MKKFVSGVIAAAAVTGALLGAGAAQASPQSEILGDEPTVDTMHIRSIPEFASLYANAVCVDDMPVDPTRHRIWIEVSVWATQTNLTRKQVEQGIGYTINTYCPQYAGVYSSYQSYY